MAVRRRQDCNFFGILDDGEVRKILLTQDLVQEIRETFVEAGNSMMDDVEEIEFTGNYNVDQNEILYVELGLPQQITNAVANPIGTADLDIANENLKTLFWYENGVYYFQNFDKRKLLRNKSVIVYSNQTFNKLEDEAFIVDKVVNAIHKNGRLFFLSYANANRIFSLVEYYREATDEEIRAFGTHEKVSLDEAWFLENTNSTVRKQVTLLYQSNVLNNADTGKIKKHAKKFKLTIDLDNDGKICFPNDKKACKDILLFLNEQYWIGLISGEKFKTNSKRKA